MSQQKIIDTIRQLTEEQAKLYLEQLFSARQYGNQELIQTMNELTEQLMQEK